MRDGSPSRRGATCLGDGRHDDDGDRGDGGDDDGGDDGGDDRGGGNDHDDNRNGPLRLLRGPPALACRFH